MSAPRRKDSTIRPARFAGLETERLLLRRLRESDLGTFLAYRNDPEVARYQAWEEYAESEARGLMRALERAEPFAPGEWFQFAVELKAVESKEVEPKKAGTLVGDLGFKVEADGGQAEVGFTLAREHWGKGYASEAVSRLLDHAFPSVGLHRVYAVTDQENLPSIAVLERLGLRREGAFVQNAWFKGRWSSEYLYATLREEWPAAG